MPWSSLDILLALPAYALVLFRLTGLALTAPIYGSRVIPARLRGALIIVVAAMMFPAVGRQAPGEMTLGTVVVGGAAELLIGLTIGLSLGLFVSGVELAGLMVGRQSGIALAQVYDPSQDAQVSVVGQVYTITLMTLFLLAGGHRATMAALLDTFEVIPLLSFRLDDSIIILLAEMLTAAFILGIRMAGPALIALFLTSTAVAFLSRTMPQLNILSVGFTLRVLVAMAAAGLALAWCQDLLLDAIWDALETIRVALRLNPEPLGLTG